MACLRSRARCLPEGSSLSRSSGRRLRTRSATTERAIFDITYIRLARGFVYLVAIIDWYSRRVLSWRISNSMEAIFCVDCLEEALRIHGQAEIFNSDQGAQFTSAAFTGVLEREGIVIGMDGRG